MNPPFLIHPSAFILGVSRPSPSSKKHLQDKCRLFLKQD